MLPGEVPSDYDVDTQSLDETWAQWRLLLDLNSEFGGAWQAYAIIAVLIPCVSVASIALGWVTKGWEGVALLAGAVLFISLASISIYSLAWFLWARKRLRRIEARMDDLQEKQELEDQAMLGNLSWDGAGPDSEGS